MAKFQRAGLQVSCGVATKQLLRSTVWRANVILCCRHKDRSKTKRGIILPLCTQGGVSHSTKKRYLILTEKDSLKASEHERACMHTHAQTKNTQGLSCEQ